MSSNPSHNTRRLIFKRDEYKCLKCGSSDDITIDHINPRALGGTNAICNLQTLCAACNQEKADSVADYRKIIPPKRIIKAETSDWGPWVGKLISLMMRGCNNDPGKTIVQPQTYADAMSLPKIVGKVDLDKLNDRSRNPKRKK